MSVWLNNKKPIHKADKMNVVIIDGQKKSYMIEKPCHELGYCPYGQVIEEFPFSKTKRSCKVFGHDCPVYYMAELIIE